MTSEEHKQIVAFLADLAANGYSVSMSGGLGDVCADIGKVNVETLRAIALMNFKETNRGE